MLFAKNEKKKRHPIVKTIVGAFAALGAVSAISAGKSAIKNGCSKMTRCVKNMCKHKPSDEEAK